MPITKEELTFSDFGLTEDPFPFLGGPIRFRGVGSGGLFDFGYYNAEAVLLDRTLADHLPFAAAYWHFRNPLQDMFSGSGTAVRPWDDGSGSVENAENCIRAFYYMCYLLQIPYWCFHDVDLVGHGGSLKEFHSRIDQLMPLIAGLSAKSGIEIGWTTQNLFSFPRYTEGAATSPDRETFELAWAQTRFMLDKAKELQDAGCGCHSHVFWGGREGYRQLLSTMMGRERQHLAAFLKMAVYYADEIGLDIQFLIEPKWCEPSTHQYDASAVHVLNFLREFNLLEDFRLNLEVNHAQLAGLTIGHEITVAQDAGVLGGIDVNEGTFGNGWDTDRFLVSPEIAFEIMYLLMRDPRGLGSGVLNFDAKLDRGSHRPEDLVLAHIASMDALALAAATAAAVIDEGKLDAAVRERYDSFDTPEGGQIAALLADPSGVDLIELAERGYSVDIEAPSPRSAGHEGNRRLIQLATPRALELLNA